MRCAYGLQRLQRAGLGADVMGTGQAGRAFMLPSMKRLAVSTRDSIPPGLSSGPFNGRLCQWADLARFCQPSIRAHQGRAHEPVGAGGDSKGGGAIYAAALQRRPRQHSRSPTHRTCERSVPTSSLCHHVKREASRFIPSTLLIRRVLLA